MQQQIVAFYCDTSNRNTMLPICKRSLGCAMRSEILEPSLNSGVGRGASSPDMGPHGKWSISASDSATPSEPFCLTCADATCHVVFPSFTLDSRSVGSCMLTSQDVFVSISSALQLSRCELDLVALHLRCQLNALWGYSKLLSGASAKLLSTTIISVMCAYLSTRNNSVRFSWKLIF
jgi:hypothetical protein